MYNFEKFEEKYGIKIEKNHGVGLIENFNTEIFINKQYPFVLSFQTYLNDESKREVIDYVKSNFKNVFIEFNLFGFIVGFTGFSFKKIEENVINFIDQFVEKLHSLNALDSKHCPVCGEEFNENKVECKIDQITCIIDTKCKEELKASLTEANESYEKAPNNVLKGLLGALIGGVAAVAVYFILVNLGFFSSLSSFVGIVLGAFLYTKFGGKPSILMIVIVSLVTIIFLLVSNFGMYVIIANRLIENANEGYTTFTSTGLKAFFDCMSVSEFKAAFISDTLMTAFFTVLGAVYEIIVLVRNVKSIKQKIE